MSMKLNEVKKRILPISESVKKGFESEAKINDFEILKSLVLVSTDIFFWFVIKKVILKIIITVILL